MGGARWGVLCLIAGLAIAAGLVWMLGFGDARFGPDHSPALYGALVLAAALLVTFGVRALRLGREGPEDVPDYRHAWPVLAGVAVLLGGAGLALGALVPEGYGLTGAFRADAPVEARQRVPRHVGEAACADCHEDKVHAHDKDAHATVPCETCHGPGQAHVAAQEAGQEAAAPMKVHDGRDWCLVCHRPDPARPPAFPQIDPAEHFRFLGVSDPSTKCSSCHDPHEPLFMDRDLRTARLHPLVHRCRDCHGGAMAEDAALPARHPATFRCGYCHGDLAARFEKVPHRKIACGTCHLFFRDSEFAGRIIRDTDPRFCLLCHREAPFKGPGAPPQIRWPDHRDEMSDGPSDKRSRCVDCHRDAIHWPEEGGSHD